MSHLDAEGVFSFSSVYKGTSESENATKNYIKNEICKNFYLKIPLYYHFFDNKAVLICDFNSCNFVLHLMRQPQRQKTSNGKFLVDIAGSIVSVPSCHPERRAKPVVELRRSVRSTGSTRGNEYPSEIPTLRVALRVRLRYAPLRMTWTVYAFLLISNRDVNRSDLIIFCIQDNRKRHLRSRILQIR